MEDATSTANVTQSIMKTEDHPGEGEKSGNLTTATEIARDHANTMVEEIFNIVLQNAEQTIQVTCNEPVKLEVYSLPEHKRQ